MSYAEGTNVPAERSRAEIETLVQKYAGRDAEFTYGKSGTQAAIAFRTKGRRVQFTIPLPTREEAAAQIRQLHTHNTPNTKRVEDWLDAETRRRFRCLLLVIKAKFTAVEVLEECDPAHAAEVFEREFLAHITNEQGRTVYEIIQSTVVQGHKLLPPVEEKPHA